MNLLIATTVKNSTHAELKFTNRTLITRMMLDEKNNQTFDNIDYVIQEDEPIQTPHMGRYWQHARARNQLIHDYLDDDYTHVLWLDADIVACSPSLPSTLYKANPNGITAPLVLIEGGNLFYDTMAFIEGGKQPMTVHPYFRSKRDFVNLDCVGSVYLIPAHILRRRMYASTMNTEHYPVMMEAISQDLKVGCLTTETAYHARVAEYEELW